LLKYSLECLRRSTINNQRFRSFSDASVLEDLLILLDDMLSQTNTVRRRMVLLFTVEIQFKNRSVIYNDTCHSPGHDVSSKFRSTTSSMIEDFFEDMTNDDDRLVKSKDAALGIDSNSQIYIRVVLHSTVANIQDAKDLRQAIISSASSSNDFVDENIMQTTSTSVFQCCLGLQCQL
jgi:hypothetical protein